MSPLSKREHVRALQKIISADAAKLARPGCVNADGFIFSSSEKQLAVSLDSNIFVSSPNCFRSEAPMQNDSGCDSARNYFLRV
jgi:hypothetical protein